MSQDRLVWNRFIRFFHWTLVIAFIVSFLSGENELEDLHNYSGYYIALLLAGRIAWGLVSRDHSSFADFLYSPAHLLNYVKLLIQGKAPRYIGHNPLGGMMVLLMLCLLVMTVVSGLILYGINDYAGPLYLLADLSNADQLAEISEEVHEFGSHAMLPVIALHLLGVAFSSFYHRENLVRAMISGKKKIDNH